MVTKSRAAPSNVAASRLAAPPTLRMGDKGPSVVSLQKKLAAAGFSTGAADGDFGQKTLSAVQSFQKAKRLTADGVVGPQTWGALMKKVADAKSGAITDGGGWGGSKNVANAAKKLAASMKIPVTSQKRDLATTRRVGSSTTSDHYTGNKTAFAVDFGVAGARGDQLARAIAEKYGIPQSNIGTFNGHIIKVNGARYRLQLLWRVTDHFDHVHLGILRA
jgi:peptidoglycan hydrolase-like protein with peptidoglycan-binding domain